MQRRSINDYFSNNSSTNKFKEVVANNNYGLETEKDMGSYLENYLQVIIVRNSVKGKNGYLVMVPIVHQIRVEDYEPNTLFKMDI